VKYNRRKFLGYSALLGAGIGGGWLGLSQSRGARWLRRIIADSGRSISPAPVKPDLTQWSDNAVTICWIGHATVLINFYGIHLSLIHI